MYAYTYTYAYTYSYSYTSTCTYTYPYTDTSYTYMVTRSAAPRKRSGKPPPSVVWVVWGLFGWESPSLLLLLWCGVVGGNPPSSSLMWCGGLVGGKRFPPFPCGVGSGGWEAPSPPPVVWGLVGCLGGLVVVAKPL